MNDDTINKLSLETNKIEQNVHKQVDAKVTKKKFKKQLEELPIKLTSKKIKTWFQNPMLNKINILIYCSFNNTRINASTLSGQTIQILSAGMLDQKNTKRGRSFSAKETAVILSKIMQILGTKSIKSIYTTGLNKNNKSFALMGIFSIFNISLIDEIIDITPKKFNGPRLPGKRRV